MRNRFIWKESQKIFNFQLFKIKFNSILQNNQKYIIMKKTIGYNVDERISLKI